VTDSLGGSLGGMLEAYEVIGTLQDDLDSFAATFAEAINSQHASGYDADGNAGGDVFTVTTGDEASSLAVDASLLLDASLLALAGDASAAAGDGTNLAAMVDLQDQQLFDGATETAEEFVAGIYATIGSETAIAQLNSESAAYNASDLDALYTSMTGVDLDEEAVALIEWQAAYQAAARVISASDELLAELMEMAR